MKNVLAIFSGNEIGSALLLDTDKFDISNEGHKMAKEAIECALENDIKNNGKKIGYFSIFQNEINDNHGYFLYNLIHEIFVKEQTLPFMVEHKIYVHIEI